MGTGAMIVADGTTSQGELTRPLEKLGSVSVAQRMVDTFAMRASTVLCLFHSRKTDRRLKKIPRAWARSV